MENLEPKMLREISNDDITTKKYDSMVKKDLHERISEDENTDEWDYQSEPIPLAEF